MSSSEETQSGAVSVPIPDPRKSGGLEEPPLPQDSAQPTAAIPQGRDINTKASSPVDDPEKKHRRALETRKLNFGIWLIIGCLVAVVVLAIAERFLPISEPGSTSIGTVIDMLKLIATTVLGYVFGRGVYSNKDEN